MTARQCTSGKTVNRMLHVDESTDDLLTSSRRCACSARRPAARSATWPTTASTALLPGDGAGRRGPRHRLPPALPRLPARRPGARPRDRHRHDRRQGRPLASGRASRPTATPTSTSRSARNDGLVLSGTKAIVTAAPYVHEFLVMPCRTHRPEDADCAVCCAVPLDADGPDHRRAAGRAAGRGGRASSPNQYGQSTGVRAVFDDVFVPWERVFLAGETAEARPRHHGLRHPSPPHLHRCARRLRRPADRRRAR